MRDGLPDQARRGLATLDRLNSRQLFHDPIERALPLEADAGAVGKAGGAVRNHRIVGEAAEIAEHARI